MLVSLILTKKDSTPPQRYSLNLSLAIQGLPNTYLELTGLSDRILNDFNDYSLMDDKIDYSKVWQKLYEERVKSEKILNGML